MRFASGITTRTRKLIEKAREINSGIIIATTRKTIPYTKKIALKAVAVGGAAIHRLGLSESILIFDNHYSFLGGLSNLENRMKEQKNLIGGKILTVEVKNPEDARMIANSGVDIIQLNGIGCKEIKTLRKELYTLNPAVKVAVTGNITLDTVDEYARTGADILVTSWPYYAEPCDLLVTVVPIFDVY